MLRNQIITPFYPFSIHREQKRTLYCLLNFPFLWTNSKSVTAGQDGVKLVTEVLFSFSHPDKIIVLRRNSLLFILCNLFTVIFNRIPLF